MDFLDNIPCVVRGGVQHLVKGEPCVVHDVVNLAILSIADKQRKQGFGGDSLDSCVYDALGKVVGSHISSY